MGISLPSPWTAQVRSVTQGHGPRTGLQDSWEVPGWGQEGTAGGTSEAKSFQTNLLPVLQEPSTPEHASKHLGLCSCRSLCLGCAFHKHPVLLPASRAQIQAEQAAR